MESGVDVLILVLVEHTLRGETLFVSTITRDVLILVLVEHTLRDPAIYVNLESVAVLILVLVEHTLRGAFPHNELYGVHRS